MNRLTPVLLAVTALAVAITADKSPHHSAALHHGYGYKPFSYSYSLHQPYRQKTHVQHYQHALGYGYGYPYGYGHHYGHPYRYGHHYGLPAYSHVQHASYPANYAQHLTKVHPNKYADQQHVYAYKPAQFGYSSTVVHPIGPAVLHSTGSYRKPAVLHREVEKEPDEASEAMSDGDSASGGGMPAEEVMIENPVAEDTQ